MNSRTIGRYSFSVVVTLLSCVLPATLGASNGSRMIVYLDRGEETIAPEIYGHFAEHLGRCIYDGIWVGPDSPIPNIRGIRTDVVEALKAIQVPVLRWPGGCFADDYHWKDGIGPRGDRPKTINTHWGMVTETNAFGTHEFMDLCEMLGSDAYIAGNVGSGTVDEMGAWVEYLTSDGDSQMAELRRQNGREEPWRIKYFGVGNENWGCGGNMSPSYYADLYKNYQTYVRKYSSNEILKVACGPGSADYNWLETVLKDAGRYMDAISLHHYVRGSGGWGQGEKGSATDFDEGEWFALMKNTLTIYPLLEQSKKIMDRYDPQGRIALYVDEWGTWWDAEPGTNPAFLYQQNTIRDAVSAGVFLNSFNTHCDRVKMANIAQTVNVLQAMILTDGPRMVLTPTYHVFEMYKVHQGATLLPSDIESQAYEFQGQSLGRSLIASSSRHESGMVHVTICNLNPTESVEFVCELDGGQADSASGRVLTAETITAHNTFEAPNRVRPRPLTDVDIEEGKVVTTLPARSVTLLAIESSGER